MTSADVCQSAPDTGPDSLSARLGILTAAFSLWSAADVGVEGAIADPQTNAGRRADGVAYDSFVFDLSGLAAPPATIDIVYYNDGRDGPRAAPWWDGVPGFGLDGAWIA